MSNAVRIDAVSDESEADFIVERNRSKGFTCSKERFGAARWDGTDLGGLVDIVQDAGDPGWLVISRK
jgi:hypothetical protein